jgi:hypothetical protein
MTFPLRPEKCRIVLTHSRAGSVSDARRSEVVAQAAPKLGRWLPNPERLRLTLLASALALPKPGAA